KLLPGEMASVHVDGNGAARIEKSRYWTIADVARDGLSAQLEISDAEAVAELTALLKDAVARQMMGDVPLGAFLSGGIDSSTIV
ncbi:asparagine synthase-related protein, partial [Acinetobacter baumannii]